MGLSPFQRLSQQPQALKAWLATKTDVQVAQLRYHWPFWARPEQLAPIDSEWLTWLILAGRGFGKTRAGSQWVIGRIDAGSKRIALVGATSADVRDIMIEGESGILACSPPWNRPKYEPSKRRLTWPNGAIATAYSADEPDRLRGPQHDDAWCDELAAWKYPEAFDQLKFGLRLGKKPRVVVTTTPRPTKIIKKLMKEATTRITGGSTYDNQMNLAASFFQTVLSEYQGTRLGRQEIFAHILDDTPGALWTHTLIDQYRVQKAPELVRIVVPIDPSTTNNKTSAECGIVPVGLGVDGHGYVLADGSKSDTPSGWASHAVELYKSLEADRIVAEVNNGGDLVETVIRVVDPDVSYKAVRASRGKQTRAEPISALYEQGLIHHVGAFPQLEDQMTTYVPGNNSPDRMDSLVWGFTELMLGKRKRRGRVNLDSSSGTRSPGWGAIGYH